MTFLKALSQALCGLSLVVGATAAHADALKDIKARGSIIIAVDFTHPPYGMLDDKSQQVGTDIEMARQLAQDMGVKLEVVPVTGPNRIPFLLTNKADIVIASVSVTEERKKVIAFSKPYATQPLVVVAQGKDSVKDVTELSGKQVAAARGTTADLRLTALVKDKDVKNVEIVRYVDESTARTAVSSGQQKIFAASLADAHAVKTANPALNFEVQFRMYEDPLAIALRRDEPELQAWLDDWVLSNLKNGKLNATYRKYFGLDLPQALLEQK
jgi:polar amino acid transport system substrate-binding protein